MRYDSESNIIRITLGEFVSIARRGISPSVSFDEDEPSISPVAAARLKKLIGELYGESLSYRFISGEWVFELVGKVEDLSGNKITIARTVESNPHHPRKSEVAEIRGEGYIAAYMLAHTSGFA